MGQLLAAIDRPLPLRQRPDLVAVPQWFRGQRWVVVQDPLAVTHFYLTEAEHALLAMLDGRASIAEIRERYERRFAPQKLDAARFHQFLVQLHKNSLVVGDLPGQGEQLALRRKTKEAGPLRWLEKLLAIRFRGIHPQGLLAWLDPRCGWIFGRMGLAIWLVVVAAALLLTIARVGELPARWAGIAAFSAPENLLWLGLALAMVKTLHELGHALAARRCGCPVREMGLQLFFLLPCLYTNVSEVSLVPSKWRRMAVSAAGIYVELFLAAVAMLLWWFAEPGPLASLCAGIMLVASIGTLVLNGNPLMRYDGYYLLADWAEMPNLEQRSRTQLLAWLARWGLGYDWHPGDSLDEGRRSLLALFAAAALAYRGAVMVGVYFGVRVWLAPWGLAPLADLLAAASIVGLVAPLAAGLGQILMQARSQNQIRPGRVALSGFVLALLVAAAIWIPLPQRVVAPAVLQPRDPSAVYVTTAGTLLSAVESGAFVKKGDVLARLENLDLRRDLARLQAQHREQEVRLIQLETTRDSDPTAAAAIPATQERSPIWLPALSRSSS
ncbi:MAG: site-2 protease family protein [Pirellulaceae bacterium]|nr:site-2 protease family protein [Pirellulaceae bacterium]